MVDEILARSVKYSQGRHPNSLATLRKHAYKPGENGHQFGGYNLTERLKHRLYGPAKPLDEKASDADQLVASTIAGAILREPAPFHEVWDRVEGKVPGDQPLPTNQDNRVQTFVFVLPDGSRLRLGELIGNSRKT